MLVHREATRLELISGLVSALTESTQRLAALARPSPDAILEQLIDAGELEAGIAAAHPADDDDHPDTQTWRTVTLALGRAFVAATGREHQHAPAHLAHAALVAGFSGELPKRVAVTRLDSFDGEALFPQMSVAAARQVVQARSPSRAVVIGLGPEGAVLSAVVTAALEQQRVESDTVLACLGSTGTAQAERGVGAALHRRVAGQPDALLLLVGRGGDGAAFASVASSLSRVGVRAERIVLLPHEPTAQIGSEARRTFERHDTFAVPFETAVLARGLHGHTPERLRDISGGLWRELAAMAGHDIPSHPLHERRKYLTAPDVHGRVLLKFAGLGRRGRARLVRAERLAGAGFAPAPDALDNGFLAIGWVDGSPMRQVEAGEATLRRMAEYLVWLRLNAQLAHQAEPLALAAMVRVNVGEALGATIQTAVEHACDVAAGLTEQPAVAIDGRMFPHEWIRTAGALVKTDGLEHHDDAFYPGPHDIAWDLAGAISEWGLDSAAETFLIDCYVRGTGDAVRERLPYYQLAYDAFRFGYDTLAARDLAGTDDGARFAARARARQIRLARYAARFA